MSKIREGEAMYEHCDGCGESCGRDGEDGTLVEDAGGTLTGGTPILLCSACLSALAVRDDATGGYTVRNCIGEHDAG